MTTDATGAAPETLWDYALLAAEAIVQMHTRRARESGLSEDTAVLLIGADRPLVVATIAAAIHVRAAEQDLTEPQEAAMRVLLAGIAEEQTLTGTLRRRPYEAVVAAPRVRDRGLVELSVLDSSAKSAHPDTRYLWERVRAEAAAAVAGAAAGLPGSAPWWDRGSTIEDIVAAHRQQQQATQLSDLEYDY